VAVGLWLGPSFGLTPIVEGFPILPWLATVVTVIVLAAARRTEVELVALVDTADAATTLDVLIPGRGERLAASLHTAIPSAVRILAAFVVLVAWAAVFHLGGVTAGLVVVVDLVVGVITALLVLGLGGLALQALAAEDPDGARGWAVSLLFLLAATALLGALKLLALLVLLGLLLIAVPQSRSGVADLIAALQVKARLGADDTRLVELADGPAQVRAVGPFESTVEHADGRMVRVRNQALWDRMVKGG
jgi:hypothetical protein